MRLGEVVTIGDLSRLEGQPVHETCTKAVAHQVDDAETSVFVVKPGGMVKAHVHSKTWDLFFGVSGEIEITFQRARETGRARIGPRGFCAMPPAVVHEVRNPSEREDATFVLIHAPWAGYDLVKTDFKPE